MSFEDKIKSLFRYVSNSDSNKSIIEFDLNYLHLLSDYHLKTASELESETIRKKKLDNFTIDGPTPKEIPDKI